MVMKWYKQIKAVLTEEPELWLSYIHGQQLNNITHLKNIEPRYKGLPTQLAKFSYLMLRTWHPAANSQLSKQADYFFFAGTSNQMDSLESTIDALQKKGASVIAVAPRHLIDRPSRQQHYTPYTLSTTDMMKATLLLTCRGNRLYKDLNALHPKAVDWWYSNFCTIYTNLPYFQRALRSVQPKFVITANDHNAANRCMLAIAHLLDIKTVYLQHASVSELFPALRVNYAFLDGQSALDTYRQCEINQPKTDRRVPLPKVFLSGQKKPIIKCETKGTEYIGIALNSLDNIKLAVDFINQLSNMGHDLIIRWHPGQAKNDIDKIHRSFRNNSRVSFSDPKQESVNNFLSCITWLIAGNSSIHLEAVLAGVSCIYCEVTPANIPDYYGYVKNGLVVEARSMNEISNIVKTGINMDNETKDFVRYYSATYQTEWEGREGELVAEVLFSIIKNKKPPINPLDYLQLT